MKIKKTPMPVISGLVFLIVALYSCKKEVNRSSSIPVDNSQTKNSITPYFFNWETTDYMPSPPGTFIPVPWASFTNQGFSQDIRYDYKSSDGWSLVYNTFSPTSIVNPKSFVLYNKYRGLIRYYLYVDAYNAPTPSTYITHSLKLEATNGATSSLLNYSGKDLINFNTNLTQVNRMIDYKVSATSGWYAFDFELAYDPAISTQIYENLNLRWSAGSTNVTQVNVGGQINGTLKGTIGTEGPPPNLLIPLAKGVATITGLAILDNNPNLFKDKVKTAITSAINSGFQGAIKNLFNGIFGGSTSNVQQVNLNINSTITLTGTEISTSGLLDNVFVIPGISNSQTAPGYTPLYNSSLGVFNISNKPNIKYTIVSIPPPPGAPPRGEYNKFSLQIDPNSYQILFNPAVTNSAAISNIKTSIICYNPTFYYECNGVAETVGELDIKSKVSYVIDSRFGAGDPLPFFAIRISFDVTPNNGSPKATIVKTFIANVVPL